MYEKYLLLTIAYKRLCMAYVYLMLGNNRSANAYLTVAIRDIAEAQTIDPNSWIEY